MTRIPQRYHSNKKGLRVIETVDNEHDLNQAIENGHITLFRKIKRNSKLYSRRILLRNYQSGRYEEVPARSFFTRTSGRM